MANRFPLIFNSGAGQIQELAASDNLDLTSSNLVNAGILSTSSGSDTAPSLQIGSGTTYNPGLYSPGTDQLAISTGGTGRLFVDASGNFGVGAPTPSRFIDFEKNQNASTILRVGNTTSGTGAYSALQLTSTTTSYLYNFSSGYATSGKFAAGTTLLDAGGAGGLGINAELTGILLYTASTERARIRADGLFEIKGAGTAVSSPAFSVNQSAPSNSFFIDSSGRLGIGTTGPNVTLEVASTSTDIFRINKTGVTANGLCPSMAFQVTQTNNQSATLGSITGDFTNNWGGELVFSTKSANSNANNTVTERARIDSSGRMLVGTPTARTDYFNNGLTAMLQVEGINYGGYVNRACVSIVNNNALTLNEAPVLILGRSNGATLNSKTPVTNGTKCGYISFQGADGSDLIDAASIAGEIDGDPGSNVMPGRLVFFTNSGTENASPAERMRITSIPEVKLASGVPIIVPYAYATTTASAANAFVGTDGNIFRSTSSRRWKTDIEDLQPAFADQILNCRPVWYRSTSEKDNPEWGFWGFIAEEVAEVDPRLVFWKTHDVVVDGQGNESTVELEEPLAEGVQYDRFVPHLLNLIKRQGEAIAELQSEVASLKAQ
jgi:hypothetical protein